MIDFGPITTEVQCPGCDNFISVVHDRGEVMVECGGGGEGSCDACWDESNPEMLRKTVETQEKACQSIKVQHYHRDSDGRILCGCCPSNPRSDTWHDYALMIGISSWPVSHEKACGHVVPVCYKHYGEADQPCYNCRHSFDPSVAWSYTI